MTGPRAPLAAAGTELPVGERALRLRVRVSRPGKLREAFVRSHWDNLGNYGSVGRASVPADAVEELTWP